jgi:hypothetical protein
MLDMTHDHTKEIFKHLTHRPSVPTLEDAPTVDDPNPKPKPKPQPKVVSEFDKVRKEVMALANKVKSSSRNLGGVLMELRSESTKHNETAKKLFECQADSLKERLKVPSPDFLEFCIAACIHDVLSSEAVCAHMC